MNNERKSVTEKKFSFSKAFLKSEYVIRDIIVVVGAIALAFFLIENHQQTLTKQKRLEESSKNIQIEEEKTEEISQEEEIEMPVTDMSDWQTYASQWYGFELKYPKEWPKPILRKPSRGSKWEYKFLFRKEQIGENDLYQGFDLIVYSVKAVKELYNTEEYPLKKENETEDQEKCNEIKGHLFEDRDFSAEEIYNFAKRRML